MSFRFGARGLGDHGTKLKVKGACDAQESVDGGHPLLLFHAHHHGVAEARLVRDFILRTSNAEPLLAEGVHDVCNDLLPVISGRHADCVAQLMLDIIVPIGTIRHVHTSPRP